MIDRIQNAIQISVQKNVQDTFSKNLCVRNVKPNPIRYKTRYS